MSRARDIASRVLLDNSVTSAKIVDGAIVNGDINASAAIAQSKVASLTTDLAARATLTGAETLTNKTLTSPRVDYGVVRGIEEDVNVVASAATGTINFDVLTASIWFYTSNASADHTLNIRGDGSNTLNSILPVGDAVTVVWMNTNGATPYRPNVIQIDGSAVTSNIRWQGGTAPTAGNASSIDVYTFTIIKTAATPTYTVLGAQTRFA